jgi:hypothetical protein
MRQEALIAVEWRGASHGMQEVWSPVRVAAIWSVLREKIEKVMQNDAK